MDQAKIEDYYLQENLVDQIVEISKHREIAPTYRETYGERPDSINYPEDFESLVKNGAIAFHGSVEIWRNPLLIDSVSSLNKLRTGWDLLIDIDCDEDLLYSKIAAEELITSLNNYGVKNVSVKFSGNRGFHLGVHRMSFPDSLNGKDISQQYPKLPKAIVSYLKKLVKPRIKKRVAKNGEDEDPYNFVDIENNWGNRHLFRLPYSLNEKSWLVSKPLKPSEIMDFEKKDAKPDKIEIERSFLLDYNEGEATDLTVEALDWYSRVKRNEKKSKNQNRDFAAPDQALSRETFPPCISLILEGLEDGRKRSLFILLNFLQNTGYSWDSIEQIIWNWNEKNEKRLRKSYINNQIKWHKNQDENVAPPNCDNEGYYQDIGICQPDKLCEKINNPLSYAFKKAKFNKKGSENKKDKKSKDKDKGAFECPICHKRYKTKGPYKKHVQQCFEE